MDGSDSCISELLNGTYFSVSDRENNLTGYYCFGESAQVPVGNQFGVYDCKDITDVGLGINPILCGQGLGLKFFSNGLDFARNNLLAKGFRLTVATFNQRAIKIYQQIGFKKVNSFERKTETDKMDFWVMILH
ncbi:GNAT family N-acetyltransferase [Candidatus Clostridium stratigraminis]|uniref:GNAT family N-acetyltransferase n=1 Tax=Candidatus Clostridium stratigraminis TaxID=3381661 RepID=A0ABW8T918_9CLOT